MEDLPIVEFAFPGELRDSLVELVLSGRKTTTTGLLVEYTLQNEPLPVVGGCFGMVDSNGAVVGIIETVGVDVTRLRDVTVEHARDEGEGHTTVAQWRAAHEKFWHSDAVRCELGDPTFTVDDDTPVVLERFRLAR
mgnify:CR=1 FL=1